MGEMLICDKFPAYSIAQIDRLSNSNKCIFRFLCKLSVKRR